MNEVRLNWVAATHVRRHHQHYHCRGGGHLYQGRFKSFPVAEDKYFLAVCRYVEANPPRAKLVDRAEQWRWSGLWRRTHRAGGLTLSGWPVKRPSAWLDRVNARTPKGPLDGLRACVQRGRPFGPETWVRTTAARLGLGFTLRGPGRPRTIANNLMSLFPVVLSNQWLRARALDVASA